MAARERNEVEDGFPGCGQSGISVLAFFGLSAFSSELFAGGSHNLTLPLPGVS